MISDIIVNAYTTKKILRLACQSPPLLPCPVLAKPLRLMAPFKLGPVLALFCCQTAARTFYGNLYAEYYARCLPELDSALNQQCINNVAQPDPQIYVMTCVANHSKTSGFSPNASPDCAACVLCIDMRWQWCLSRGAAQLQLPMPLSSC